MDEDRIIADVKSGNAEAFRGLVERYQRPVFRMVANLVGDEHAAEDLTQEVFLAAYRSLRSFDPDRSRFSTWLFTIARNRSVNHLRDRKKRAASQLPELRTAADPSGPMCRDEFNRQMDRVLSELPPRQKRAFILAEFEQLPYDQIAQIECTGIGTVKSRIHRAKQKLRKALEQFSEETYEHRAI